MARLLRTGSKRPLRSPRLGQLAVRIGHETPTPKAEKPKIQEAFIQKFRTQMTGGLICCGLSCFNGMQAVNSQEAAWALRATIGRGASSYSLGTNYVIFAVTEQQFKAQPDQKKWLETAGFELLREFPSSHIGNYPIYLYGAPPLEAKDIEIIPLPQLPACQLPHHPGAGCTKRHI